MATTLHHLRGDVASSDVVLFCQGRRFHAHRVVLSAGSLYFRSIFHHIMRKKKGSTVNVSGPVTAEVLDDILEFMYSGNIRRRDSDKDYLLSAVESCKFLQIEELFAFNLHVLAEYWSANDLHELANLIVEYEDTGWPSELALHILNKFCHVHKRQDFLNLRQNELNKLLQYLTPHDLPAAEFGSSILFWLNHDNSRNSDIINPSLVTSFLALSDGLQLSFGKKNYSSVKGNKFIIPKDVMRTNSIPKITKNSISNQKLITFRYEGKNGVARFYDIESDKWSKEYALPFSLMHGSAIIEFEQHGYFLGGSPSRRTGGSAEVTIYCPASNTSIYKGSLCFPVVSASAGVLRGSIYVVGGKNWLNHLFPTLRVQRYDPTSGKCIELEGTYNANWRCQVIVFEDYLYVIDLDGQTSNMERYDPNLNQWTIIVSTFFNERLPHSVLVNDQLYLTVEENELIFRQFNMSDHLHGSTVYHGQAMSVHQMWPATVQGRPVILIHCDKFEIYLYDIKSQTWEKRSSTGTFLEDHCGSIVMECRQPLQFLPNPSINLTTTVDFMRRQSICTDVTLLCNGIHEFQAHQLMLSTASPFFKSMFASGFKESVTGVVNLPTMTYKTMENILEYIYTGKTKDQVLDNQLTLQILAASHLMNVPSVFHQCLFTLVEDLSHDNYLPMFDLATYLYDQALTSHIATFLVHNFIDIIQQDEFLEMEAELLKRLLNHPELERHCKVEGIVEAAVKWMDADFGRDIYIRDMMSLIHVNALSGICLDRINETKIAKRNQELFLNMINEMRMDATKDTISGSQLLSIGWNTEDLRYEVRLYDVITNKWSKTVKEFPISLPDDVSVVAFGSYVYLLGGVLKDSTEVTTQVFRYCLFKNVTTAVGRLQIGFAGSGVGVLDDAIYVVGGKDNEGKCSRLVQRFIPSTNLCEAVAHTSEYYYQPNVCPHKALLYVVGSTPGSNNVIECYNSLLDQWTVVTPIPLAYNRCSSVFNDGNLYFLAVGDNNESAMHVYNCSTNAWTPFQDINTRTLRRACRLISGKTGGKSVLVIFQHDRFFKLYDITKSKWLKKTEGYTNPLEGEVTVFLRLPKNE